MNLIASIENSFYIPRAILGVIGLLLFAYFLSSDRKAINLRVVFGGLLLQFIIAFGVLKIVWVESIFGWIAHLFAVALQLSLIHI